MEGGCDAIEHVRCGAVRFEVRHREGHILTQTSALLSPVFRGGDFLLQL